MIVALIINAQLHQFVIEIDVEILVTLLLVEAVLFAQLLAELQYAPAHQEVLETQRNNVPHLNVFQRQNVRLTNRALVINVLTLAQFLECVVRILNVMQRAICKPVHVNLVSLEMQTLDVRPSVTVDRKPTVLLVNNATEECVSVSD